MKQQRNKIKTLCTIQTTDIDIHESKIMDDLKINGMRNKRDKKLDQQEIIKKLRKKNYTPSSNHYQQFFRTEKINIRYCNSQNKNKFKFGYFQSDEKEHHKTDYDGVRRSYGKSLGGRKSKSIKNKIGYILEDSYRLDTYEIMDIIDENGTQKIYRVRKLDKIYIMKKTKREEMKKEYENQSRIKSRLMHIKWKNLSKLVKVYHEKYWMYAIYDDYGECLSWNNVSISIVQNSHCQVVEKILKYDGIVLKHIIKQLAKGINELSSRGYVHNRVRFENVSLKIQEYKTTIKIEGSVRLCNLGNAFCIKDKTKLISLPEDIYTPPQLINLKLFQNGQKFDRQLIQYINCYDEAWLIDVWALGVLILELVAGETISIEKAQSPPRRSDEISIDLQNETELKKVVEEENETKEITLIDILEAQKSLLYQTELQISKLQFDKKLQSLVLRMLSVNPLNRPSPKQIIKDL